MAGGTLLVIGARGFAGAHLSQAAREAGMSVIGASHRGAEPSCDLTDPASVRAAVSGAKPDFVANMAGVSLLADAWSDPVRTLKVNAIGVANLLEALADEAPSAHLLCVSSAEVYGAVPAERIPVDEETPTDPLNPYGASKVAMEMACAAHVQACDAGVAVARSFNKIGPGQPDAFAASSFARQVAEAEREGRDTVEIRVGNLRAARDFTDVRDSVRAYVTLLERRITGTFNCCSGRAVSIESVIENLQTQSPLEIVTRPDAELKRPAEVKAMAGSNGRLRDAIGWQPEIPIERSLADLLAWWRGQLAERPA